MLQGRAPEGEGRYTVSTIAMIETWVQVRPPRPSPAPHMHGSYNYRLPARMRILGTD